MLSTSTDIDSGRVAKLMQGLGICLHHYQQIEVHLKLLLPHLIKPGSEPHPQAAFNWRELLDSRTTLGALIETFKGKIEADDPESLSAYLTKFVAQRNDLVHHMLTDQSRPLRTAADVERAIDEIRQYMRFASPLLQALREATSQFAEFLALEDQEHSLLANLNSSSPSKGAP